MSITTTRNVHFAAQEVSAVFHVPRKTESEALTLFYQPEECDRFRAEARLEKLALRLSLNNGNTNIKNMTMCTESLNALTELARCQFKRSPVAMHSAHGLGGDLPPTHPRHPSSQLASRGAAGMA